MNRVKPTTFYGKHLGPTLKAALEELIEKPHYEQVQIYEELALSRAIAAKALAISSAALENGLNANTAIAVAKDALNHVRDMVVAASRIETSAADKISISVLDLFITQILRIIKKACEDHGAIHIAEIIESQVREHVKLPQPGDHGISGTVLTPDITAKEMDASIFGKDPE